MTSTFLDDNSAQPRIIAAAFTRNRDIDGAGSTGTQQSVWDEPGARVPPTVGCADVDVVPLGCRRWTCNGMRLRMIAQRSARKDQIHRVLDVLLEVENSHLRKVSGCRRLDIMRTSCSTRQSARRSFHDEIAWLRATESLESNTSQRGASFVRISNHRHVDFLQNASPLPPSYLARVLYFFSYYSLYLTN
ncbi:hypothetical protein BGY98DRAFT_999286 [Russula aff. rugulosa BPL654]|nr:hypothetical protein BGY98DRAFT_999286 [Russula aff. rugulosa BPL654]